MNVLWSMNLSINIHLAAVTPISFSLSLSQKIIMKDQILYHGNCNYGSLFGSLRPHLYFNDKFVLIHTPFYGNNKIDSTNEFQKSITADTISKMPHISYCFARNTVWIILSWNAQPSSICNSCTIVQLYRCEWKLYLNSPLCLVKDFSNCVKVRTFLIPNSPILVEIISKKGWMWIWKC